VIILLLDSKEAVYKVGIFVLSVEFTDSIPIPIPLVVVVFSITSIVSSFYKFY